MDAKVNVMQNPFQVLGLSGAADEQAVREAYRKLVKTCHPDAVMDEAQKVHAQDRLIELNLAYEEALKRACRPSEKAQAVSPQEILRLAQRLLKQNMSASAIRALERSHYREATWHYLYGVALMQQHRPAEAHTYFRVAVRAFPENKTYRTAALKACVAQKKQDKRLSAKVGQWGKRLLHKS